MKNDEKLQKDIMWKQSYRFEFHEDSNWFGPSNIKLRGNVLKLILFWLFRIIS